MTDWMKRYRYYLLAVILLIVLLVVRSLGNRHEEVEVAEARVGPLTLRIAASGLVSAESADLAFQGTGRIVELYVKEGDTVGASELLARVSPVGAMPGALGGADVIQAPYDGTVVTIYQRAGSTVSPGQPVLRLVPKGSRWVTVFLESEDAVHLRRGQTLRCRAGGYLSEAWDLTVEEVGQEAIPRPDLPGSSRQVPVRCAVVNPAFPLAPGTEVDVDGEVSLADNALLIPTAAVVHEGVEDWVWVVEGNAVRRREIKVGPNNFDLIQIRQGLRTGETVVVHGKQDLREGQQVRVKPMPPMTEAAAGGD